MIREALTVIKERIWAQLINYASKERLAPTSTTNKMKCHSSPSRERKRTFKPWSSSSTLHP